MLRSFDRKLILAYEGAVLCFVFSPQMIVNLVPVPFPFSSVGSFKVSGGCDFVRKTMDSFKPATASTCLIVDLHGYDCWPALAALEDCGVPAGMMLVPFCDDDYDNNDDGHDDDDDDGDDDDDDGGDDDEHDDDDDDDDDDGDDDDDEHDDEHEDETSDADEHDDADDQKPSSGG